MEKHEQDGAQEADAEQIAGEELNIVLLIELMNNYILLLLSGAM